MIAPAVAEARSGLNADVLKQKLLSAATGLLDEASFGCFGSADSLTWTPDEGQRANWLVDMCEPQLQKTNLLPCPHCSRGSRLGSWELRACDVQLVADIERQISQDMAEGRGSVRVISEEEAADRSKAAAYSQNEPCEQ